MVFYKNIREMEQAFYGDILKNGRFSKADANVISTTTAVNNKLYGAKVWSELTYEANAMAILPKEPWVKTGWRTKTAAGASYPSGGQSEGATTTLTALPDTIHPTYAYLYGAFKKVTHTWGASDFELRYGDQDDDIPVEQFREDLGKEHVRAQAAMLVNDVDTPASTSYESLDRVCSNATEASTDYVSAATDPDIFGVTRASGPLNAYVSLNGKTTATLRDLTITIIDNVYWGVKKQGGAPKVILTGYNTMPIWSGLLEAERRYDVMGKAMFVPRYNDAEGASPGVDGGFAVSTYFDIPIIESVDYTTSVATARTDEIAPILFLDTDYVRFAVKEPTAYYETDDGDKASIGQGKKGWYDTYGELRCYNFAAQGKVRDCK